MLIQSPLPQNSKHKILKKINILIRETLWLLLPGRHLYNKPLLLPPHFFIPIFLKSCYCGTYQEGHVRPCQLIVSHIAAPANTLTWDISLSGLPSLHCCIRLSSSNSFKLYQFLPRYLLQLSFCCPLCCFRHQAKCTENTGKTSHSSFLWHSSQEGQLQIDTSTAPVGFCDTLFPGFFSNSKPLKRFLLETKYCELKSDNRLEYQMYFVSFSEAA